MERLQRDRADQPTVATSSPNQSRTLLTALGRNGGEEHVDIPADVVDFEDDREQPIAVGLTGRLRRPHPRSFRWAWSGPPRFPWWRWPIRSRTAQSGDDEVVLAVGDQAGIAASLTICPWNSSIRSEGLAGATRLTTAPICAGSRWGRGRLRRAVRRSGRGAVAVPLDRPFDPFDDRLRRGRRRSSVIRFVVGPTAARGGGGSGS